MGPGPCSLLGSLVLQRIHTHFPRSRALDSQPRGLLSPSLCLQPQTRGSTWLPDGTAEQLGSRWEEALARARLVPLVPGQKEVKSPRSRAPLGPEHRLESRGRNLGSSEAPHWSRTRVSLHTASA